MTIGAATALTAACGPGTELTAGIPETSTTADPGETTTTDDPTTTDDSTAEPPPVECIVTPGDHANAVCPAGDCTISADVELSCDDYNFSAPGLRVAAAPNFLWLATASESAAMLYRVGPGDLATPVAVPARFQRQLLHLATGPAGDLHVAAEVPIVDTDNGVAYLSEAAGFAEQTVHANNAGSPLAGFQVTADGAPDIFFFGDGPDDYREARPDGQGGWQISGVSIQPGSYGNPHFNRDAKGRLLAYDAREVKGVYRLGVEVDGVMSSFGKTLNIPYGYQHYVLAPSASPTPPSGPPFAAIFEGASGIEVVWPLAGTDTDSMKIPGHKHLTSTCFDTTWLEDDEAPCPAPCHELGQGFENSTTSFTRTPDGLGWVVLVSTQQDFTYVYNKDCRDVEDGGGCSCPGTVTDDLSSSILHVFRVTLDDTPPVEVLTMPLPRLETAGAFMPFGDTLIATHTHAFADSLAIGLRLRGPTPGQVIVRALRLELAGLKP